MMKKIILITVSFLFIFLLAYSEDYEIQQMQFLNQFNTEYDYAIFKHGNSVNLEIYLKVPLKNIKFQKTDNKFSTDIEYITEIYSADEENLIHSDLKRTKLHKDDFARENVKFLRDVVDVLLPKGEFIVVLKISDLNTQVKEQIKFRVKIIDLKNDINLSDIMFAKNISESFLFNSVKKRGYSIIPTINRKYIKEKGEMFFYYEIYNVEDNTEFKIKYEIKNTNDKAVLEYEKNIQFKENVSNYQGVKLDISSLSLGKYILRVILKYNEREISVGGDFEIVSEVFPVNIPLRTAIRSIRYISNYTAVDTILNAKPEEQVAKLKKFWQSRDKVPSTETNEYMEEYYTRVLEANQLFDTSMPGWETDRGRIYIKYGKPDEIERHPFEMDSRPYEIWYYYSLGKEFVFVDYGGFGNYELYNKSEEE